MPGKRMRSYTFWSIKRNSEGKKVGTTKDAKCTVYKVLQFARKIGKFSDFALSLWKMLIKSKNCYYSKEKRKPNFK